MNLTKKDQLLLTVLLPVLIAATYGFLWLRPTLKETARLENSLRAAGDEQTVQLRREQLNAEQSRLRKSLAEAEAQDRAPRAAPPQAASSEDPAASLRRLQDTFHRNGVRLVCATVQTAGDTAQAGGVAENLRKTGVPQPKTWDVMVEASYAALLRLLDDCGTNRFPVVPVALSMRPNPGDSKTTYWTLNVCL